MEPDPRYIQSWEPEHQAIMGTAWGSQSTEVRHSSLQPLMLARGHSQASDRDSGTAGVSSFQACLRSEPAEDAAAGTAKLPKDGQAHVPRLAPGRLLWTIANSLWHDQWEPMQVC